MKKYFQKATALLMAVTMASSLTACGGDTAGAPESDAAAENTSEETASQTESGEASESTGDTVQEATGDPFMKFAEPVEIHIGQQAYPTLKFPDGDTNEDNVYTR